MPLAWIRALDTPFILYELCKWKSHTASQAYATATLQQSTTITRFFRSMCFVRLANFSLASLRPWGRNQEVRSRFVEPPEHLYAGNAGVMRWSYGDDGDARLTSDDNFLLVVPGQLDDTVCDGRVQVIVATDVFLRHMPPKTSQDKVFTCRLKSKLVLTWQNYTSLARCTPLTPFRPISDAAYRQHAEGGPSHWHRQHTQKKLVKIASHVWFRRYPRGQRDRQTHRVTQKFGAIILYALTLPNINRFSKLFHHQNQEKICNNTIAKDPTTPRVSLHYLVKCQVS